MATYKVFGQTFLCDDNYTFIGALGKGAYGVVCAAREKGTRRKVAIKKISPVAKSSIDAKHVLREIRLMRHLGRHRNIVTLRDLYQRESHDEMYIVMDFMDTDLHRVLQSDQRLSETHFQHFMYQLLRGILFCQRHDVLHRDLKPGNLLVNRNCDLKISDFGLARVEPELEEAKMTEHVVTRWYRPPELMLCPDGQYDSSVDMWSVGCIFAEMLGRRALFPGKNFIHQLSLIFDVIGAPKQDEVAYIRSAEAQKFLRSQAGKRKVAMAELFPHASTEAVDLLERMLVFHPPLRLTVEEALEHPFFNGVRLRYEDPELVDPAVFEFDFDDGPKLTREQLRQLVRHEVLLFAENRACAPAPAPRPSGSARRPSSASSASSSLTAGTASGTAAAAGGAGTGASQRGAAPAAGGTAAERVAKARRQAAERSRSRSRSRSRTRTGTTGQGSYGPQNAARRASSRTSSRSRSRSGSRSRGPSRPGSAAPPALEDSAAREMHAAEPAEDEESQRPDGDGGGAEGDSTAAAGTTAADDVGVSGGGGLSGRVPRKAPLPKVPTRRPALDDDRLARAQRAAETGNDSVRAVDMVGVPVAGISAGPYGPPEGEGGDTAHGAVERVTAALAAAAVHDGASGGQPKESEGEGETAAAAGRTETYSQGTAAAAAPAHQSRSQLDQEIADSKVDADDAFAGNGREGRAAGAGAGKAKPEARGAGALMPRERSESAGAAAVAAAEAAEEDEGAEWGGRGSGAEGDNPRSRSTSAALRARAALAGRQGVVAMSRGAPANARKPRVGSAGRARDGGAAEGARPPLQRRGSGSRRKVTVPKSPAFSQMSWQRRPSGGGGGGGGGERDQ